MKLNPYCVREILIYLEENLDYTEDDTIITGIGKIPLDKIIKDDIISCQYDAKDIKYTIKKLIEAEYIQVQATNSNQNIG